MGRMIDADKLKKDVLDLQNCYNGFSDTYDKACIIGVIDEQPSAQPDRKKGKWIFNNLNAGYGIVYHCSSCNWLTRHNLYAYCPNCGADMRGDENV